MQFTGGDRKRYFVLDGPVLLYYKDAEKKVIGKEWPKQIMLSKQSVVKRAIQSSKEKTSDMIELKTMRRSYFLKTSGAKEVKVLYLTISAQLFSICTRIHFKGFCITTISLFRQSSGTYCT